VEAANGSIIDVLGLRLCKIQIGDNVRMVDVIVARNLCDDLILGMDLLSTHQDSRQHIAGLNNSMK
jgi:predicted aspartyl protease